MYKLFLLLSGTFSAGASILLRIAGRSSEDFSRLTLALIDRPMMLRAGALCAYAAGFICYAVALKKIELSIAYPLMVGVTIFEILVFSVFTNETVTIKTVAGAACLLTAMFLLYSPSVETS